MTGISVAMVISRFNPLLHGQTAVPPSRKSGLWSGFSHCPILWGQCFL